MRITELVIPDACVPYIRWQRSNYRADKVPNPADVKAQYAAAVARDYEMLEPHLPYLADTVLEIGCGVGSLAVMLARRYPTAALELLDGDGRDTMGGQGAASETGRGGWNVDKPLQPYNARPRTEELLSANGVDLSRIRWRDIGTREHMVADLIVSLASCGYHYPVKTYSFSGLAIMDLRKTVEAPRGRVIMERPKYYRCVWAQK